MAAGPFLTRAGLDLSVTRALTGLDDLHAVDVRVAPVWLRRFWVGPVRAMTVRRRVFVAPEVLAGDSDIIGRLLIHELVHVRQWSEAGAARFLGRYLGDYLRGRMGGKSHREAYAGIRYEVEARVIAGE